MLSQEVRDRLLPHLALVDLPVRHQLGDSGGRFARAFFPVAGVVSLVYPAAGEDGRVAALVGSEGLVGLPMFMGDSARTRGHGAVRRLRTGARPRTTARRVGPPRQLHARADALRPRTGGADVACWWPAEARIPWNSSSVRCCGCASSVCLARKSCCSEDTLARLLGVNPVASHRGRRQAGRTRPGRCAAPRRADGARP